mmetsp:Transcript_2761/g.3926  ORF Transcript_2761/g.3926 Transcript_2761/m.3926 type:complete len:198 (-) Transcript_2761:102-695(-)|eukprot:CAMPEP_0117772502 /NCGR_PEP_ID=MMETSP0947-20121206/25153_1 /TAXON_ID=44440 /ORGANISM="Chattonella subsalsa, Strain CCMP2191" /LENGTH=197 /DNA_ID=CAMNT_0005598175 /DNA_START=18 /DNA_END=611 /DNA_ORIENTATION=+
MKKLEKNNGNQAKDQVEIYPDMKTESSRDFCTDNGGGGTLKANDSKGDAISEDNSDNNNIEKKEDSNTAEVVGSPNTSLESLKKRKIDSTSGFRKKATIKVPSSKAELKKIEDNWKVLLEKKTSLREELTQIEKQIYDLEANYLEETRGYGNILVGWNDDVKNRGKDYSGTTISPEERLFSLSSVSSPASVILKEEF